MEGKFRFGNLPAEITVLLVFVFLVPTIMWTCEWYLGTFIVFIAGFALMFQLCALPGSYSADEEGVTIKVLFRTYRFVYSNIRSVNTSNREGGHSRTGDMFSIITKLTINTSYGIFHFQSEESGFHMNDQLKNPERFKKQLDELEFVKLADYIRSHIPGG